MMKDILSFIVIALDFLVGAICLLMAYKQISARQYLPFHEAAAGMPWQKMEDPLQNVILTIMKISGLGFLAVGLLLTTFPIMIHLYSNPFLQYAVPILALIYSFGLFLFNYRLYKSSKVDNPWKLSAVAAIVITVSIILSIIGGFI